MRVAVCAPQVPFVRGGAELMAADLVDALRARGHEAELVSVPFKWYPGTRVLDQAFLWRLVDLTAEEVDDWLADKTDTLSTESLSKVLGVLRAAIRRARPALRARAPAARNAPRLPALPRHRRAPGSASGRNRPRRAAPGRSPAGRHRPAAGHIHPERGPLRARRRRTPPTCPARARR